MPARPKHGFTATRVTSFVAFNFSAEARAKVVAELHRCEKPPDATAVVQGLEAICSTMLPWEGRRGPTLATRRAGLRKAAGMAASLQGAIRDDGLFGADWFEVQGFYRRHAGGDFHDLLKRLRLLEESCEFAAESAKRATGRHPKEPFDLAADSIGSFYWRELGTAPASPSFRATPKCCACAARGFEGSEQRPARSDPTPMKLPSFTPSVTADSKNRAKMPK